MPEAVRLEGLDAPRSTKLSISRRDRALEMEVQHYRTRFTLKATGKRSALDAALDVVRKWATESADNMDCTEALAVLEGDDAFCSGASAYPAHWHGSTAIELPFAFATARFDAAGSCAWAFEMDKLDGASKMKMRRWHTRIGILGTAESVTVNIQITHRIRTGFFGEVELPFANVPRIVKYFMKLPGMRMCVGNIDVTDREVKLDHKKLRKEFTLELTDTERELPLVVLSTKRNGETSLGFGNSALLAEKLVGMAKVYVVDVSDDEFLAEWSRFFRMHSAASWDYRCPFGSLKVYFPHLDLKKFANEETTHCLPCNYLKNLESLDSLVGILVDGMARLVGKRATDVLDIADVEWIRSKNSENRLTQRMRKLIAERNEKPPVLQSGLHNEPAEEQSESHEAGSDALSKECDEWQQLALDYDAENRELNVQLAELEASLAEATAKADALEHGLSNRNVPAAQAAFVLDAIPETLMDVLKVAERQWPDRIVLTDASWKGAEDWNDNEGNIPDEYDIVKSVATVLYDMAINGMPYEGEFSQAFQNETGFELALKEGSQTKKNGKMMDKRSVEFDGKEYGMQMHVKGRNPKIGFRLYCEPDKERGIIVIGHCGHHLETAGTARRAVNK